ncbi:2-succinyl-5-enolpyruvyl-6-hydroxy-3-cyclohexene-1-carboxylic-acid synthase [Staphylococcus massiliensis]|uniref:2-succinyl-5-enolpyruvyl-6-hydroxy-3-cyclohexene-1-carboxylate synthase n=1 Tax=Staphylococcus massiliensis S46 TaxID=1229783 RepID=K9AP51_9STAP|nr:2-succinyl-5-enolpyruvyl-6-hydroxy-3-cyclohexene-1-carboxylic-acid synthase [Staphylococcus massiliensis]EKU47796.1 menaquinone biosynthesis bifunctional protein [Staphylococcus massiliensis S46]MCG3399823.1 2-succinyl-5-enolpyruvyl-6-hydroxy-3-cyclohexene-1-carboxylic-acid synthase [Staphylococcus massiliensis]MCG3401560.1 2-succinyl-5-enolpyruvyl-6-hydroxy-3-cyclohexene-1-carboxylic-acid synthase [Staphylococcus massiliensis]PNZ98269.1 2-succinyl-5-enolpyruvyl-6-hydroxy-3-cyclohexene-1-car
MSNHKQHLTEQVFKFVSELYAYGMREIVVSPGSRSTPLAIACEMHPNIKTWIHPDERSAAFFALGLIKGSNRPVAVLCTSGTAAANYVPAVAECAISHLPLIVLTSDRPHELRGVGAPQAIDQVDMFQNYVRYAFDFPIADGQPQMMETISYQLQKASCHLKGTHMGPIHFNLPFREPLTPDLTQGHLLLSESKMISNVHQTVDIRNIEAYLSQPKGLIIVGDIQHQEANDLLTFATIHDLPILADPLSELRHTEHQNLITSYDLLMRSGLDFEANFVIRVGRPVISKKLNQWLKKSRAFQILVQESDYPDAFPKAPDVTYEISINDFFKSLHHLKATKRPSFLKQWQEYNQLAQIELEEFKETGSDEAAYVSHLIDKLPEGSNLFVSNSMPIRDVDTLLLKQKINVYANRGANGIDGVVSTALGMAVHKDVTLLIGDLAFYHDMNGLLMAKLNDINLNIVLLNNDGGGIFNYLPQHKEANDYFERLFGTPTGLDFKHTAYLYDFNYQVMNEIETFKHLDLPKLHANIIEIQTNRDENQRQHEALYKKMGEVINATL